VSDAAVEAIGLVKRYRRRSGAPVVAVDDVSLSAPLGAVTALLGPNGAGKTTTLDICTGLRRADGGRVRVLGLDPTRDRPALRCRVGVMPQSGVAGGVGVSGTVRAGDALRLFASYYRAPLSTDALLARLGLERVAGTPWRRLSGGEQQRLSLALAIVGRPELVFLDEPTAGLDVQARHAVFDLVRELRAAGVSIVLTTHAMDEAEALADHVVIVDRGRVVASGSPTELTSSDEHSLSFSGPAGLPLDALLAALPPSAAAEEPEPGRYVVTGDVDPAFLATVTAWCAGHGVMPRGLTTGERSLEDVFLELTGRGLRQ
jgi:ABC-2 type transport system ATP-binding protein